MPFLAPKKSKPANKSKKTNGSLSTRTAKPTPTPKPTKIKYVEKVKVKPMKEKPVKVTYVVETPPAPVEERLPLDPTQMKWNTQEGALILVALSFLGHAMSKGLKTDGHDKFMYATKCEALGLPVGTREFDLDHLEQVTKKIFHIYAKGQKPENVSKSVYELVFYPGFRGGYMYSDMGKQR